MKWGGLGGGHARGTNKSAKVGFESKNQPSSKSQIQFFGQTLCQFGLLGAKTDSKSGRSTTSIIAKNGHCKNSQNRSKKMLVFFCQGAILGRGDFAHRRDLGLRFRLCYRDAVFYIKTQQVMRLCSEAPFPTIVSMQDLSHENASGPSDKR